jgi:hypothetical protein
VVPATQIEPAQQPAQVAGPHDAAPSAIVPASSAPQTPPLSPAMGETQSSPSVVQSVHDWPPKPHAVEVVPDKQPVGPQHPDAHWLAVQRTVCMITSSNGSASSTAVAPSSAGASPTGVVPSAGEDCPVSVPIAVASRGPASLVAPPVLPPQPKTTQTTTLNAYDQRPGIVTQIRRWSVASSLPRGDTHLLPGG